MRRRFAPASARLRVVVSAVVGLLAVVSSGCATTYDDSLATQQASTSTSSTLPTGSPDELLPRLVEEAAGLSGLMIVGSDAGGSVQRIEELWAAVADEVNRDRPDLLASFAA